jgi:hypothetical protein
VETGTRLERSGEWARVERLIALARSAYEVELTPERREQMRQRLLEKLDQAERERERRRNRRRVAARVLLAGASTIVLAGLVLKLARVAEQ